jgi:hypothetical protein
MAVLRGSVELPRVGDGDRGDARSIHRGSWRWTALWCFSTCGWSCALPGMPASTGSRSWSGRKEPESPSVAGEQPPAGVPARPSRPPHPVRQKLNVASRAAPYACQRWERRRPAGRHSGERRLSPCATPRPRPQPGPPYRTFLDARVACLKHIVSLVRHAPAAAGNAHTAECCSRLRYPPSYARVPLNFY